MTITLFVKPDSFLVFAEVVGILKNLEWDNNYTFNPTDLVYSESMIPDWIWVNLEVTEYMKLRYCIIKLIKK